MLLTVFCKTMKGKNFFIIIIFVIFISIVPADAVPAYPGLTRYKLPDNTTISIRLRGDERLGWAETPDGFTLLLDEDNYWTFAVPDGQGGISSSKIRYKGDSSPAIQKNIQKKLTFSLTQLKGRQARRMSASGLQIGEAFPSKGKRKLLMVLVNYADTKPTYTQEDFWNFMNENGYKGIGSFRDYYLKQSYGLLDIETTVTPWITLDGNKGFYGQDGAIPMIVEALKKLDKDIDFTRYDNDGDGVLDGLAVIHQGNGQEMSGNSGDIWSHSSEISGLELDGVKIRRYTIQPETMSIGGMTTVGVICHEFGHNLGAPDFYDTDYEQSGGNFSGTGPWDLMGSGAWNGEYGDRPAGINMWQKQMLGWCTPAELSSTQEIAGMPASGDAPVSYKINTTENGEYFIIENRQQTEPFDIALPGHGLIIYHVNEKLIRERISQNNINAYAPQAMYTVCASATTDPDGTPSSYGDPASAASPYPGVKDIREFGDDTTPSAHSISGRLSYFSLSGISENNGKISFGFIMRQTPQKPVNLTAEVKMGVVTLHWQLEHGDAVPSYYSVYRDGKHLADTSEPCYCDEAPITDGMTTYSVDATYMNGLTSPYEQISTCVPGNKLTELTPARENDDVRLRWTVEPALSRTSKDMSAYYTAVFNTDSIDFAHRYTATDLATYKGCKITSVRFCPITAPSASSYQVRVWETDNNGKKPKIVASRDVTEFGYGTWREITLSEPVTIVKGRDYYIGVHCKSTDADIQLMTDKGPAHHGLGNYVKQGDTWKECAGTDGNFYIIASISFAESKNPSEIPVTDGVEDPYNDLMYPIGFCVYRDEKLAGVTGNMTFVDVGQGDGTHKYAVSCLYRGDNESVALTSEYVTTGLHTATGSENEENIIVTAADRNITVKGDTDSVTLCDASGRTLLSAPCRGSLSINVKPGLYIVKTKSVKADKILIE